MGAKREFNTVSATPEKIRKHLEFLGYTIEKKEPDLEEARARYYAKHGTYYNIHFFETSKNTVLFRAFIQTSRKANSALDIFINEANKAMTLSRIVYFLDEDSGHVVLVLEAVYVGKYAKDVFGEFHAFYCKEPHQIFNLESWKDFKEEENSAEPKASSKRF